MDEKNWGVQNDEEFDRDGGEEPNPTNLWWTSTHADEMMDDITIITQQDGTKFLMRRVSDFWKRFRSSRKDARLFGRKNVTCKQGLV